MLTPAELAGIEDLWPFQRELGLQTPQMLSVTGVMRRAGLVRFHVSREQLTELAAAGRDVHMVCEDIARGKASDYWSALPAVAPYARSFQKFVKDFDFQVELIEHRLNHPYLGYTGRLDQAGWIFARSRSRRRAVIIDVKRGAPAPSHRYQTVAYAELVDQSGLLGKEKISERWCIYLGTEGYVPQRHNDRMQDFQYFTALLTTARIRQASGLISLKDESDFDNLLRARPLSDLPDEPRL